MTGTRVCVSTTGMLRGCLQGTVVSVKQHTDRPAKQLAQQKESGDWSSADTHGVLRTEIEFAADQSLAWILPELRPASRNCWEFSLIAPRLSSEISRQTLTNSALRSIEWAMLAFGMTTTGQRRFAVA